MCSDVDHHLGHLDMKYLWDKRALLEADDYIELESFGIYHVEPPLIDLEN